MKLLVEAFKASARIVLVGCLCSALSGAFVAEAEAAATGTLFGVAFVSGANALVAVDPSTGSVTPVASFPGLFGVPQGVSALDATNHRYFFPLAGKLFVVDTQTGAVIASSLFPLPFSSLEFESTTGTLFGVAFVSGANALVVVDPSTGTVTPVASFPGLFGVPQGVSALDATNHRYYFPLAGNLFVVDTQTGAVIANPPFPLGASSLEFESVSTMPVAIDVKPGNPSATVNYGSRGSVRVGILSSSTFDAPARIDRTSLTFGATGDEKSVLFCNAAAEDVNHDGLADLICYFDVLKAGLRFSEGEAILKGKTRDGIPILGTDSVRLVPQPSVKTSFNFATLNFPGAVQTRFFGLNDLGDAVGDYLDAAGTAHAFLRTAEGTFSTIDPQSDATFAEARGINNVGEIVGFYIDSAGIFHGFLVSHSQFSRVDFPGAVDTALMGINSNGDIVGSIDFGDVTTSIAFVLRNGKFTSFEDPVAAPMETEADAISVTGQTVGVFLDATGTGHGYLLNNGVFSTIDFPGAVGGTFARGINAGGQIVGRYFDGPQGNQGFVVAGSTFSTIRFPNASVTAASGVNAHGQVIGFYRAIASGPLQGFLATPRKLM